jgi:NADPH-dependent 2,4-dienoyl-CoA reductase/sulfur reductase-like enzyme
VLVVGGSDAGISAALRARELDESAEVSVLLADRYPNFSICGLPYYLSGAVPDWRALAHRTIGDLEAAGIEVLLDHTATVVDALVRTVTAAGPNRRERQLRYDELIVATGALPLRPPIAGLDLAGVLQLHTMSDAFRVAEALAREPESAVIVGAGYIGLEMAEALHARGLMVTVVEQLDAVLPTVDPEFGTLVREELERHGLTVHTGTAVRAIEPTRDGLRVGTEPGPGIEADLVLVVVGVQPDTRIGRAAGLDTGARGALRVNRLMETNLSHVYAAGDCAVTYHRLLGADTYIPLGTTAHKQGRIAGENAIGGSRVFEGSLGTQVVKIFELAVARTGLRDHEARTAGLDPLTIETHAYDRTVYYPGAREIAIRITGDPGSGRLHGAQFVGHHDTGIPKRVDVAAAALHHGMTVEALNDLDLSYTPPFGSPWDPLQAAAQAWTRASEPVPVRDGDA